MDVSKKPTVVIKKGHDHVSVNLDKVVDTSAE